MHGYRVNYFNYHASVEDGTAPASAPTGGVMGTLANIIQKTGDTLRELNDGASDALEAYNGAV